MVIMSRIVCKPMNFIQARQEKTAKIVKINLTGVLHCVIILTSVVPCGPDEVSIKVGLDQ